MQLWIVGLADMERFEGVFSFLLDCVQKQ